MEKHLNVLSQALNKANIAGVFNLQESVVVAQALGAVIQALGIPQPNPIEDARAEARDSIKLPKIKNTKPLMEIVKDSPINAKEPQAADKKDSPEDNDSEGNKLKQ